MHRILLLLHKFNPRLIMDGSNFFLDKTNKISYVLQFIFRISPIRVW